MTLQDFMRRPEWATEIIINDLYKITNNPRYATLIVMIQHNYPALEYLASGIWESIGTGRLSTELIDHIKGYRNGEHKELINELKSLS